MEARNLFQPFEIQLKKSIDCPLTPQRYTFFELVYIVSGEGNLHTNQNKFAYQANNMFLIMPQDKRFFEVKSMTSFLFIRFNNIYLKAQQAKEQHSNLGDWIQKLEYVFQNSNNQYGCIIRDMTDRPLARALIDAIIQEYVNRKFLQHEMIQQLVNTLITLVARNISMHLYDVKEKANDVSLEMLHYIHQHIYSPEKLKAEHIASHFNISVNYVSEYFKKHTSENLQQYIINYKLKLAEIRLRHSDMRMNEIAYELGFTDESHLNRTFRKYRGMKPSDYRKASLMGES